MSPSAGPLFGGIVLSPTALAMPSPSSSGVEGGVEVKVYVGMTSNKES